MFLHVKQVQHVKDYVLRVEFIDGVVKDVDLIEELHGEIFAPLRDPDFFKQVSVNEETQTVEWPNGADFAPESLYEIGKEVR
jgi:5'(3')-deoxyribonucleotidase